MKNLPHISLILPNNNVHATKSSQINIQNSLSINVSKKELLKLSKLLSNQNQTDNIHDNKRLILLIRFQVGLSHSGDHKFRHKC